MGFQPSLPCFRDFVAASTERTDTLFILEASTRPIDRYRMFIDDSSEMHHGTR